MTANHVEYYSLDLGFKWKHVRPEVAVASVEQTIEYRYFLEFFDELHRDPEAAVRLMMHSKVPFIIDEDKLEEDIIKGIGLDCNDWSKLVMGIASRLSSDAKDFFSAMVSGKAGKPKSFDSRWVPEGKDSVTFWDNTFSDFIGCQSDSGGQVEVNKIIVSIHMTDPGNNVEKHYK